MSPSTPLVASPLPCMAAAQGPPGSNLPEDVMVGDDNPPLLEKPEYCKTSWGDRRLLARLNPGSAPYLGPSMHAEQAFSTCIFVPDMPERRDNLVADSPPPHYLL